MLRRDKMFRKSIYSIFICFLLFTAVGCSIKPEPSIINHHAEVLLTNKNELQLRFKINEKALTDEDMFKVKVQIHNKELAMALGNDEIIYGSKEVVTGKTLDVSDLEDPYIYMEPIPLLLDLHVFEIEKMIKSENAISIQIISKDEVIAKTYLTNFTSEI
jgi:hypothetical protein